MDEPMDAVLVEVFAPVNGTVVGIERSAGSRVDRQSPVVTIESGTIRLAVEAGVTGIVDEVRAHVGGIVEPGSVLVVVAADPGGLDDQVVDGVADLAGDEPIRPPESPPMRCTHCGSSELEPGFVEDRAHNELRRWVAGPVQPGLFGPRRLGRRHLWVEMYRCQRCAHLELFAIGEA